MNPKKFSPPLGFESQGLAGEEGDPIRFQPIMNEKEGKNRWIALFVIVAILSLIGVYVLTILLHKIFKG
jgi:hypothetical protein